MMQNFTPARCQNKAYLLFILILIASLSGCTALLKQFIETPKIKSIGLKSFSASRQTAEFEIALYNPNTFSIPLSGINGKIKINGLNIGSVDVKNTHSLAAHSTQKITLPLQLDHRALLPALKRIFSRHRASYDLKGQVHTSLGSIPFTKQDELTVEQLISEFTH